MCRRTGCSRQVKKATAKYCSVECCATDPERILALRARSQARGQMVLPCARQLAMPFTGGEDREAELACLGAGRDDVPAGMSRLAV